MTQDEIIEMARQAWSDSGESWVAYGWFEDRAKALEAFAKLVAEKEREALKLALEAFKEINYDQAYSTEITAIKEALAQPEQIPPSAYSNTHQPEQEPVVGTKTWFEDGKVVTQYLYPSDIYTTPPQPEQEPCDMKDMCIGCSPRNADGSCPNAPRKPLTDEQIDEIYFKSSLEVDNRCEDIYDFVRAIEAAHGIKE